MINLQKISVPVIILSFVSLLSFWGFKHGDDEKPTNLKILPKNISEQELHKVMKEYSKALGVRCGFCHEKKEGDPPRTDFASDAIPEKSIARKMMRMTDDINKHYIGKMAGGKFEKIQCVTCHMGRTTPIISIDSLPQRPILDTFRRAPVLPPH